MEKSKFIVEKMKHPITNDGYKVSISNQNIDYFGYKSKYLQLLSNLGNDDLSGSNGNKTSHALR